MEELEHNISITLSIILILSHAIKIKDKNLIIDIEELIEHDFNIYDFLIENPETFIKYLKNESELYNLKNPLIYFKKVER